MNPNVAIAKVRARIRREIAAAEEAEHEGGEINLVPYLDIVTNTVIFMLATAALSISLANINVAAPRYAEPSAASYDTPDQEEEEQLNLTVVITDTGFRLAGSGGVLPSISCKGALKNGRCPAYMASKVNSNGETESYWLDQYDYKLLREKISQVKEKWPQERQAILTADRRIPYQVVVKTMDTVRGKNATVKCTGDDNCLFDQVILSAGVQ